MALAVSLCRARTRDFCLNTTTFHFTKSASTREQSRVLACFREGPRGCGLDRERVSDAPFFYLGEWKLPNEWVKHGWQAVSKEVMRSKVRKLLIDYCELLMGRGGTLAREAQRALEVVSCGGERCVPCRCPARNGAAHAASTASISDNRDTITE